MAYKTLILKNTTAQDIDLSDIGVFVPANDEINVTELFEDNPFCISSSVDLFAASQSGNIVINDGNADILVGEVADFLEAYSLPLHDMDGVKHIDDLQDTDVSNDGIIARLAENQSITGQWKAPNGLVVAYGTSLPTGNIADGRIFWNLTNKKMYFGKNGQWVDIVTAVVNLYGSAVVFEFGYNRTLRSGSYLRTSWAASNISPLIVPRYGTIKSIVTSSTSSRNYHLTIQFYRNGSWQDIYTVSSNGYNEVVTGLDIDFDEEEQIAMKVTSGRMYYAHVYLETVWRKV